MSHLWKHLKEAYQQMESGPFAVFVVSFLDREKGLVAATTRAKDRGEEGKIGLPGGKVDPGESGEDAAKREAQEEGWLITGTLKKIREDSIFIEGEDKKIWWYLDSGSGTKLSDFKEMGRIEPVVRHISDFITDKDEFKNNFLQDMFKEYFREAYGPGDVGHGQREVSKYLEPVSGNVKDYIDKVIPKEVYYLNKAGFIGPRVLEILNKHGFDDVRQTKGLRASDAWDEFNEEYIEKIGGYDIYHDESTDEVSPIYEWLVESNKKYNLGTEFDSHVSSLSMYDPQAPCIAAYAARYWIFFVLKSGYYFTTNRKTILDLENKYMVSIVQADVDGGSFHEWFNYRPSFFAIGFDDDVVSNGDILDIISSTSISEDKEDEAVRKFKMRNMVRSGD